MNAYSRMLPRPGVALPMRESGPSALGRRATPWPAPHPADPVTDLWAAPVGVAVICTGLPPWPAPNAIMRFDLPAPIAVSVVARHAVDVARPLLLAPLRGLRVPTLSDAAVYPASSIAAVPKGRRSVVRRLTASVAGVVGVVAALAAAAIAIAIF
jgi:hypothetical protein